MSFDLVYANVRNKPQRNLKVGRKPFNMTKVSFCLPQENYDKYFLKFHFENKSIYFNFFYFHYTLSTRQKSRLFYLELLFNIKLQGGKTNVQLFTVDIILHRM